MHPSSPLNFPTFEAYLAAQYAEVRPLTLNEKTFLERYAFNQYQLLAARPLADQTLSALLADPENPDLLKRHLAIQRSLRSLERAAKDALSQLCTFVDLRRNHVQSPTAITAEPGMEQDDDLSDEEFADLPPELLSPPPPIPQTKSERVPLQTHSPKYRSAGT
ncbi:MAG: hypothetical protein OHK0021_07050 [Bryobacter sp.]